MALKTHITLLVMLLLGAVATPSLGQTCSCAGAPLLSSQSVGTPGAGSWVLGATYEYHDISSLYTGTTRLEDESVTRSTQSFLLEVNYGITDRLALSGTFTYVNKNRTTGLLSPGDPDRAATRGIGDGLVILRYALFQPSLWNPFQLALGGGVKVPFGTTSVTRNGFPMNADMQPGTGAWDGVLSAYASYSLLPRSTLNIFWLNTYRRTGTNERFAEDDRYRFGNELVSTLGVTDGLVGPLSYMLQVQYRATSSDQLNRNRMPNTGGQWLSISPALNYALSERLSVRLSGRVPIYQNLHGTQPTTSYAVMTSLFFNLTTRNDDGFTHGDPRE